MSDTVKKEMAARLNVIVEAANKARWAVLDGSMRDVGKHLNEIKQYEQSARLDYEYLKSK